MSNGKEGATSNRMNTVVKQWPIVSSFSFKNLQKRKTDCPHCGWDLFCILVIKVSNMILSKFFQHQIILNIWISCNIFVLDHTLNNISYILMSQKPRVKLNETSSVRIDRSHVENQKLALNETLFSSVRFSSFIVTCFSSYSIFTGSLSVALKQLKL